MSVAELRRIVAPPATPVEAAGSWASIEAALGTSLPRDYKEYIEIFGTGSLDDFIWVLSPFTTNPHVHLVTRSSEVLETLRDLKAKHVDEVPYPIFPEAGGLLPWGVTDNGDVLHWETTGRPDEWRVVVNAARDPRTERYEMSMSRFLAMILSGAITSRIFPSDFPSESPELREAE